MSLTNMLSLKKSHQVIISGSLALSGYLIMKFIGYHWLTISLMLLATLIAGLPIFRRAFQAIRYKIVGIDALVTIAVTGAVIIGEYWEAAAVTFLFVLGDYLESRTIEKTRSSIRSLMDLAPEQARVRRDGGEEIISPDDVLRGDQVIVKPGEKIAVDGRVIEGSAYVNQAAITGESIPLHRTPEDEVFSGTIIESGYLVIEAEKVGEDTTFARILHLVEEAQDNKAKAQKTLERFSRWYTPAIILLSGLLFVITRDIRLALTLLVISCPGALVISTPVSIVAGIGNGAKHGVLIKGGEIIEKLGTLKAVAFDKTGTLTEGKPGVTRLLAYDIPEEELLRIAARGESYSEHPLGKAIIQAAQDRLGEKFEPPEQAEIIIGQGLRFRLDNQDYLIGNRQLFISAGIDLAPYEAELQAEEDRAQTAVIVGSDQAVLGIISVADQVRADAKELIDELRSLGIRHLAMLTGDNQRAARAVADQLGLDAYYAELLPEQKVAALKQLSDQYGAVAMVGDGVNDAPALATADLGIAMGGVGTDVAMETADAVLMSADIHKLAYAVGLSRATVNNIRQNIVFALIVVAVLLVGVIFRTVNMSLGMLVHEGSVLLVILNAMRLLGYNQTKLFR